MSSIFLVNSLHKFFDTMDVLLCIILVLIFIFLYIIAAMALFITVSVLVISYVIFKPIWTRNFAVLLIAYVLVLYTSLAQFFVKVEDLEFFRVGHLSGSEVVLHFRVLNPVELHCYGNGDLIQDVIVPAKDKDNIVFKSLRIKENTSYGCRVLQHGNVKGILKFKSPSYSKGLFRIAFGSCTKFNFPFNNQGISGFKTIVQQQPDYLIMLGDFIYSDSPMIGGSNYESFAKLYRQTINFPETKAIFQTIPSYFVFDDHEIRNDWKKGVSPPYNEAIKANYNYASGTNPSSNTYFNFTVQKAGFYVLDTRTYRNDTTILGQEQKKHFFNWIDYAKDNFEFTFICASVPFTDNFWFNHQDTFSNFKTERKEIFDYLGDHQTILLTGDRHEFGAVKFKPELYEFSVSPIHQFYIPFYKFANFDETIFYTEKGQNKVGIFDIDTLNGYANFTLLVDDIPIFNYSIKKQK
eukprot:NODE_2_length_91304_cov_0.692462.p13 type:complete len:465 gc:universal NODE_2_length_91304_cov_0.692462:73368-74762(+)